MTRDEYLQIRNTNHAKLLYDSYVDNHNAETNGPLLDIQNYINRLNMSGQVQQVLNDVIKENDIKHEIVILYNKQGQPIRIL